MCCGVMRAALEQWAIRIRRSSGRYFMPTQAGELTLAYCPWCGAKTP